MQISKSPHNYVNLQITSINYDCSNNRGYMARKKDGFFIVTVPKCTLDRKQEFNEKRLLIRSMKINRNQKTIYFYRTFRAYIYRRCALTYTSPRCVCLKSHDFRRQIAGKEGKRKVVLRVCLQYHTQL